MAEYYTQFSENIPNLSSDEKAWVEKELTPPLTSPDEHECWPRFDWSFEDDDLWISSDENGCPDHVGIFVQRFLAEWRQEAVFSMTWSSSCSRLLIGTFSGGWLVVSKDEVIYGNAYCEAQQAVQALKNGPSTLLEVKTDAD